MNPPGETVYIVDDDASFRKSLSRLLKAQGFVSQSFDSAAAFLQSGLTNRPGCIVLDVRMPGLSGLDVQKELAKVECTMSIVFLTGHGDIPMGVRAIKEGASDFLTKPVDEDVLLGAIRKALEDSRQCAQKSQEIEAVRARVRTLTEREHEGMRHVIAGKLSKQIGGDLGVVERTIKAHRASVMQKMGVESVAELVRLCALLGVEPTAK